MASLHAPRPGLPTLPVSHDGQTAGPDRLKLRNSCHACAASKLKCSQDKPSCNRCAKRGLACEYVAAKRGGRKPNNRPSISESRSDDVSNTPIKSNDNVQLPPQANWFGPPSSNAGTDALRSPGMVLQSPALNSSASSDIFQDLFGPMDQVLSSASTAAETEFSDYFTLPVSYSVEMTDVDIFGTDYFPTGFDGIGNGSDGLADAFPSFDDAVSDLFAVSMPSSTPKNHTFPTKEEHNYQSVRTNESHHSCLIRALRFMEQLSPSSCLDQTFAIPTIKAVIAQNEATIEAVGTMLECSCSQDGYLLSVISLVIFKVLGWYAAVARETPKPQSFQAHRSGQSSPSEPVLQNPTVVGNYCLDGADSERMAAQLVLSELHCVRRLVDQVSSKLKMQATKKGRGGDKAISGSLDLDNEMTLPLSAVMYDQLDVALRKRLRALSLEMIDRLRRY